MKWAWLQERQRFVAGCMKYNHSFVSSGAVTPQGTFTDTKYKNALHDLHKLTKILITVFQAVLGTYYLNFKPTITHYLMKIKVRRTFGSNLQALFLYGVCVKYSSHFQSMKLDVITVPSHFTKTNVSYLVLRQSVIIIPFINGLYVI